MKLQENQVLYKSRQLRSLEGNNPLMAKNEIKGIICTTLFTHCNEFDKKTTKPNHVLIHLDQFFRYQL